MRILKGIREFVRQRLPRSSQTVSKLRSAKHLLLAAGYLKDQERRLLKKVSLRVHDADAMYTPGREQHYLSVGLSAIRCISEALDASGRTEPVRTLLDFPSGHGRVLRFLRVMFPKSQITAADVDQPALEFCRRTFAASPFVSNKDLRALSLPRKFDLIWCGSLITHLDQQDAIDLLRLFHEHLSDQGVCIFTTHGRRSVERIQTENWTYGLDEEKLETILGGFQTDGYGFTTYENVSDYGISLVTPSRMLAMASSVGHWRQTYLAERGWDNHQDVYAFTRHLPNKTVGTETGGPRSTLLIAS